MSERGAEGDRQAALHGIAASRTGGYDWDWPAELPGYGVRGVGEFACCVRCSEDGRHPWPAGAGTFVTYGGHAMCRVHALATEAGQ